MRSAKPAGRADGRMSQPPLCRVNRDASIGFFARICEDKGLHLLVEACELLATARAICRRSNCTRPATWARAIGRIWKSFKSRAAAGPLAGRFNYLGELDRAAKDRVSAIARCLQHADRVSRIERHAGARSDGQRSAGRAARSRQLFRNGRRHRRRPVAPAARRDAPSGAVSGVVERPSAGDAARLDGSAGGFDRYHADAMARQTRELYQALFAGNRSRASVY